MNAEFPPVSVIIPCLNAEHTIAEAIHSALDQTVPPLEVLVIDDGSADRGPAIAASFGLQVRILPNPVGGPGAARRFGVEQARGEFIAFVDADDALHPAKHEKQLAVLLKNDPRAIVHTGSLIVRSDPALVAARASLRIMSQRRPSRERPGGEMAVGKDCTRIIFERNPVCGASCMLRRSLILELGNYDPGLFGTEDFGMSLMASPTCQFIYLPKPLYYIRRHEGNLTNRACHMAYMHWLAQERFRRRHPQAFARLPRESIQQYMIDPVARAAKEAHWRRDAGGYAELLRLAVALAPDDPELQRIWHKRWLPMGLLRAWDRLAAHPKTLVAPASRRCNSDVSTNTTGGSNAESEIRGGGNAEVKTDSSLHHSSPMVSASTPVSGAEGLP